MSISNEEWVGGLSSHDRRNARPMTVCLLLFAVTWVIARVFLPQGDGSMAAQPPWAWPVTILPIILGVLLAYYYQRFIRGTDEMMRKIHLEALATAFGVAFVVGVAAGLLAQIDVPRIDEADDLTWAAMVGTYSVRLKMLARRYRA